MGGAVAIGSAAALAACAGLTAQQIGQAALNDVSNVANAMAITVTNLKTVGNIPPTVLSTIGTDATNAATAARNLSASMTQTQAQPVIQQVQTDVNTFLTDLGAFATNPTVQQIVQDIQLVMPLILLAAGMAVPAAAAPSGSVDAARARLAALPKVTLH